MTEITIKVSTEDDVDEKEFFEVIENAIFYSADRGELELASSGCVFPEVELVTK